MKPVIEAEKLATVLTLLKAADEPMTAVRIARTLNLDGGHETQRRRVREIIQELRDRGHWIIATLQEGYWLTEDAEMWKDWCDKKMIDGKRIIGEASRRKKTAADAKGQGLLFNPYPVYW